MLAGVHETNDVVSHREHDGGGEPERDTHDQRPAPDRHDGEPGEGAGGGRADTCHAAPGWGPAHEHRQGDEVAENDPHA